MWPRETLVAGFQVVVRVTETKRGKGRVWRGGREFGNFCNCRLDMAATRPPPPPPGQTDLLVWIDSNNISHVKVTFVPFFPFQHLYVSRLATRGLTNQLKPMCYVMYMHKFKR